MAKKSAKKSPKKAAKKKGSAKGGAKKGGKKTAKKAAKKSPAKKKTAKKAKAAPKKKTAKKAAKKTVKKAKPAAKKKTVKKAAPRKPAKKSTPNRNVSKSNVIPTVNSHDKGNDMGNNNSSGNNMTNSHADETSEGSGKSEEEERFVAHSTSLKEGMSAPYFEGLDQFGNLVKYTDFPGKTIVLYFYPKDFTEGCTKEACNLRDEYRYLSDRNYQVIGVSADDVSSHSKFAAEYHLPYPIIADTDMKIIRDYDVWGRKQLAGHIYDGIVRTTFIIGPNGIIRNIIRQVDNANATRQILSL
jgi:thioredoxin-dependent peroxiredoxin